jgi:light-regulated signal transduction histidine kinase (bacteriophytochrome)
MAVALASVVHGLGHDLREPIRIVNCYAELLRTRTSIEEDANGKEYLHEISAAAQRMESLVNGILAYARLVGKDTPARIERVDMNSVLQSALANLQMQIEKEAATIAYDELPRISADAAQLTQLMQNLVSNAIKYRGADPPQIVIKAAPSALGWRFSVQDNGAGIERKYYDRLFSPFTRFHDSETSGAGLGLAICRSIVERHGGRIWVESSPGKGSTFLFEICDQEKSRNNSKHT